MNPVTYARTIRTVLVLDASKLFVFPEICLPLREIFKQMAKNKLRITENDFLLANRKASREEEIAKYGRQILLRTSVHKSKKVYDRKRLKKAGIKITDDLPLLFISTRPLMCRC